jgi:uncharacterized protein (UPF0303 family)
MSNTDLQIIEKQEQLLQFSTFDLSTAWFLGNSIKNYCESKNLAVAIEVRFCRESVFFYRLPGTTANNSDWVRRKRNTTELQQKSSYAVGLSLSDGETLESVCGLPFRDYAHHGGSFPIRVKGMGVIGSVTISGLPQREDHNIVVQILAELVGVDLRNENLMLSTS